ncbi:unnamed protein product [Boreogadus saida]
MGEFAELTQIQQDDQSYTVSFPKLDKRETVPAASHWHRVGAKPKQHTKVNQQVHSTPDAKLPKAKVTCISRISPSLKLTLPLKNRFLPLQESTNAPATHAPLSPEMRPDGQCGQRRNKNQSPWRRAAHASATCAPLTPEMCPDRRLGSKLLRDNLLFSLSHKSPLSDAQATIRAQVEKKRDYSLPHTSTLPLSDTQIADSQQTLKRDNSPPDAINTVPSPIADAGLARKGHPPPLHSPIDDDLQPHLSHSYNNNSSPNVSSLCDFPAEYKKLEYVGIKLTSVSMIASPRHGNRLITPKRMAPQPPPPLY